MSIRRKLSVAILRSASSNGPISRNPIGLKQGWLSSQHALSSKTYWFVLKGDVLEYCSKNTLELASGKHHKIELLKDNVSVVEASDSDTKKEFSFKLYDKISNISLILTASDREECENWISILRSVLYVFGTSNNRDTYDKEAEKTTWIKDKVKHIVGSLLVIQENTSKDLNCSESMFLSCVDIGSCSSKALNSARVLSIKPSNAVAKNKLIEGLKEMDLTLQLAFMSSPQARMFKNIEDLRALISNFRSKLEGEEVATIQLNTQRKSTVASPLGRSRSETIPITSQEEIIPLSKALVFAVKSIIKVRHEGYSQMEVRKAAKDAVDAIKRISYVSKDITDQTGYEKPNNLATDMKASILDLITITKEIMENPSEEANRRMVNVNEEIPDLIRSLIHSINKAGAKVIAENQIKTATENIESAAELLQTSVQTRSKHIENHYGGDAVIHTLEEILRLSIHLAQRVEEVSGLMKLESKTKLFEAAKVIGASTSQLFSVIEALYASPFVEALTSVDATNDTEDNTEEMATNIKNSCIKFVSTCKNVIMEEFSPQSGFDIASASTNLSTSIAKVLLATKDAIDQSSRKETKQSSSDLVADIVGEEPEYWEDEPDDVEYIIMDVDENGAQHLRAATLHKMVQRLTAADSKDQGFLKFTKNFLTTYRSFTTPQELLAKLILRWNPKVPKLPINISMDEYNQKCLRPIQLRIINVLKMWIESSFFDFDQASVKKLEKFLTEAVVPDHGENVAAVIRKAMLKMRTKKERDSSVRKSLKLESVVPDEELANINPSKVLSRFSAEEIAKVLTLLDGRIFKSIKPVELLNLAWSKPDLKYRSVHVTKLIERFNQVSAWSSSMILWQEKISDRVKVYKKFCSILEYLLKFNNFNGIMAILSGLNDSAVYRLKFTVADLPEKAKETLERMNQLMNNAFSFKCYREKLHGSNPPAIPFIGIYLTDLTFINDGNNDKINHLINFRKRELESDVIMEIQLYQQITHPFAVNPKLMNLITNLPFNDKDKLYSLSLLREPRSAERSDIT